MTTNDNDVIKRGAQDGIVTLTFDDPNHSTNTLTPEFRAGLREHLEYLEQHRDDVVGVVLTSAKKSFFAGGDINALLALDSADLETFRSEVSETKSLLRRLETLGRPVVAALNGSALGGGLEIALAAHHRIAAGDVGLEVGFPEVTLGLLPGGGGIVRSVRLLGLELAVDALLGTGQQHDAESAAALGVIDEVVDHTDLAAAARSWILANPDAAQPWDRGAPIPGPDADRVAGAMTAALHRRLRGAPYPAPRAILAAAVEGSRVTFDAAAEIETQYFLTLVVDQVAKNMMQGSFVDLRATSSGQARPDVAPTDPVRVLAVIGAGMMGAGIAYQAALSGISVLLKDVDIAAGERGKDYSRKVVRKAVDAGRMTADAGDALLGRIEVVDSFEQLEMADAVVEAVFEDPDLKRATFGEIEPAVPGALLATNTSTLPISELAEGVSAKDRFIGMHFFSPVDRMPLVEIIVGVHTEPATVAAAFDLGRQLGKTPVIVKDKRGFFTSRVITKFTDEALAMLGEGLPAASIEQAGLQAGYPAPPLQLSDELTLTLPRKVRRETKAATVAAGEEWIVHPAEPVMDRMIDEFDRCGRSTGGAFYEFENGKRMRLWPGLREAFEVPGASIPFADMVERMLFAEVLEAVKCFDEGVIDDVAAANVASLIGIGFPTWTGGVIQFINGYAGGLPGFVARAEELAGRYGDRFAPSAMLVTMAQTSDRFTVPLAQNASA